jgi:hypothetical protein
MTIQLDKREKLGLFFGGLALLLVLFMLLYIPTGPSKNYAESLRLLEDAREELLFAQIEKIAEEERLRSQEELRALLEKRPANFDFFSFVNNALRKANLTDRAQLENYRTRQSIAQQPMLNLRLQGVSLEELVDFFHQIYSSGNLVAVYKVDRLRPMANNKGLDCDITLVTLLPDAVSGPSA